MNPDEYRIAQMDITKGYTWDMSSIEPKSEAKKFDWDRLVEEYREALDWMG